MPLHNLKRRWLQFSVRGLLVLTLVVALWLGHEVRHAHRVERTTVAVCASGGEAEWSPGGWSLLKFELPGDPRFWLGGNYKIKADGFYVPLLAK